MVTRAPLAQLGTCYGDTVSDRDGEQGPPSPEERGGKPPEGGRLGPGEALARELWKDVRGGADHFHLQGQRIPSGRVRQFIHGMSLPFHLGRVLLADPVARKRYLRVGLLQTVAALTLALTCMGSGKKAAEEAREQDRQAANERQVEQLQKLTTVLAEHLDPEQAEAARRAVDARMGARERKAGTGRASREDTGATLPGSMGLPADAGASARAPEDAVATDAGEPERRAQTGAVTDAGRPVRSREQRRAEAQARLDQRIRELEAAAQGRDAGISLAEAITALALETASTSDDLDD